MALGNSTTTNNSKSYFLHTTFKLLYSLPKIISINSLTQPSPPFLLKIMSEKIIILDFGSQVTQLIARRIRELNIYCEIHPFNKIPVIDESVKGIILSGSPCSVRDEDSPRVDLSLFRGKLPVLGICYGAQLLAFVGGGEVYNAGHREYGRAALKTVAPSPLLNDVSESNLL